MPETLCGVAFTQMLKIAVIGATGRTGLEIVKQSLAAGHAVIALARRPEALDMRHPKLEIRPADVFNQASLEAALAGDVDAVVSAIGEAKISKPTRLYSEAAINTIAAMQKVRIRRLVCIAASGYIDDPQQPFYVRFLQKNLLQRIFRYVYEDTMKMEKIVQQSDLDWTLVRPPRLTNGKHTESYRAQENVVPKGAKISRADLADYIVKNMTNQQTVRRIFGVAY